MANKLTSKKLQELIMEVLNENTQTYDIYVTTVPMDITVDQWRALHQEGWDGTQQHHYAFSPKGSQLKDFLNKIVTILKKYNIPVTSQGGLSPTNKSITNKTGGFVTVKKQFTSEDDFKKFKTEAKNLLLKDRPEAAIGDFRVKIYDAKTEEPIPDSTAYTSTPANYDATILDKLLAQVLASKNATELKTAKDNLTNYYTKFQADIDKDPARKTKYDNALVAKFKFDKTKFDKLYKALEDASKLPDQTAVDSAKKAITDYYNNTGAKDPASDTAFKNVPNFKAAFDLTAYSNAKATLNAEITNNNDEAKISKALADLKTYYNTNKAEVDKADPNAAADITALDTRATAAIDALKNVWKQDTFADTDASFIKDPSKSYGDAERQKILTALRAAFGNLTSNEITKLAKLSENILKEAPNKLEFEDLVALYDQEPQFDNDGKIKTTSKNNLTLAKKVEKAIDAYIAKQIQDKLHGPKTMDYARKLYKSKEKYLNLLAKSQKLTPSTVDDVDFPFSLPPASAINKVNYDPSATTKGDIARSAKKTKIDPLIVKVFSDFFTANSLAGRIKQLKDFQVKLFAGGADVNNMSREELINGAAILNMISDMTRQSDGSVGGYAAEAMLALLVAGEKTGASNGAGDFVGSDGTQYSSKFGSVNYTNKQAAKHFKTPNEEIIYVTTMKSIGQGPSGDLEGYETKTPVQNYIVLSIGLYKVTTVTPKQSFKVTTLAGTDIGGGTKTKTSDNEFVFGKASDIHSNLNEGTDKFTIQLVDSKDRAFKELFNERLNSSTQAAVKKLMEIYGSLRQIKESGTELTKSEGHANYAHAMNMADFNVQLKQQTKELFNILDASGKLSTDIGLSENKKIQTKSLKDLDKLIERVILNKMLIK